MKTTVVLNEELLNKAMKAARTKTKKATIEAGLRMLVRYKNLQALKEELGTYDLGLTLEDLDRLRKES